MEFDEDIAVKRMNSALVAAGRKPYPSDEVLNVVDMIWDYYESNGLLEIDPDDDSGDDLADDVDAVIDYVNRMLKKDKESAIDPADVPLLVKAEIDYENETLNSD